jgi:hypothetical protein
MNVRIAAKPMYSIACGTFVETTVETILSDIIVSPVLLSPVLTPVISIGGTSISSITPDSKLLGVGAA